MLYELRIYHSDLEKLPLLHNRFRDHTLKFWERYGIRQVGFWTQLIGDNNQDLYYIIAWENLAEREQRWNAFMRDRDWIQLKRETESDGPLYSHITNMILTPTAYSALK
jgi:hypothetical protein